MAFLTPTSNLKRILISRTDGLGDVICTLPIALAIKKQLPETEVAFMVRPYTASLLRRIAEIDQVLTLTELRRGLHLMKVYKPDVIIFAKPEFQLAIEALIARVDVRIGTGYRWYSGLFTRWVYDHRRKGERHEAWYSVNMLSPLLNELSEIEMPDLPVLEAASNSVKERLSREGIRAKYVVLHPGSRGSALQYSPQKYADVARRLLEYDAEIQIVVTAGPNEEALASGICEQIGNTARARMINQISLDELSELIRTATMFLGGSSGPAHLAALVRTPIVAMFPGLPPMWPARWSPIGDVVRTLVPHPEEPMDANCPKNMEPENCVGRIAVERVFDACVKVLQGQRVHDDDLISG